MDRCDHRYMSEETGLDSWFLHEKLVLSLLPQRDAIALTRRIPVYRSKTRCRSVTCGFVERIRSLGGIR
jgi:hypothetical protein